MLRASLQWETFEQYALWQLLGAHDLPLDCVLPLVPNFSFENNSEALTAVLLLLKQEKPTAELLKHLMSREVALHDRFVSSAITYWMNEYDEKLGDLISSHLLKQVNFKTKNLKTGVGQIAKRSKSSLKSYPVQEVVGSNTAMP